MKRLQFRHHIDLFSNRDEALDFLKNITDISHTASTIFGASLYAEPMVAKYKDETGNIQILVAIGVDSGNTPYHIIDSAFLMALINDNNLAIKNEEARAIAAEATISAEIEAEIKRALDAENVLKESINNEIDERKKADENIQNQILDNIVSITPVTENLSSNVREEFVLKNSKGEELGSHIRIYKDTSFVGAKIGYKGAGAVLQKEDGTIEFTYGADMDKEQEFLYFIYRNEIGGFNIVALDFENFLMEAEFGDGMKVINHVASIKIKEGEKYLSANKDEGLHTINIDATINDAINTEKTRAELKEEELQISLTNEINRAIENEARIETNLTSEIERAISIEEKLQNELTIVSGTLDTFLSAAEIGGAAIDTLKEIQSYITTDGEAAIKMTEEIAANKKAIEEEKNRAETAEKANAEAIIIAKEAAIEKARELTNEKYEDLVKVFNQSVGSVTDALNSNISTETIRATEAENKLSERIINEENSRKNSDNELRAIIDSEIAKRIENDEAIRIDVKTNKDKLSFIIGDDVDKNIRTISKEEAAVEVAKVIADAPDSFNTLKEIADYIASDTTNAAQMVNDITEAKNGVISLSGAMDTVLNGDSSVAGSINHRINDTFNERLVVNGLPVDNISIEEAETYSLLRTISVDGIKHYYASNMSTFMLYKKDDGTFVNLNDYISGLNNKIIDLENKYNDIMTNMNSIVLNTLKDVLKGTENEIAVTVNENNITIGFDENAIFGDI